MERRRLALEESWPRKWGSVFISGAATVAVGMMAAGANYYQAGINRELSNKAALDRAAESDLAERHRKTDENRAALELYLKYKSDKSLISGDGFDMLRAISSITNDDEFRGLLGPDIGKAAAIKLSLPSSKDSGLKPSDILAGSPDIKSPSKSGDYQLSDFIYYVEYFAPKLPLAQKVADALLAKDLTVPGQESMDERHSPDDNQIRYYRPEHKAVANKLAADLQQLTGLHFKVVGLTGKVLPDGVMEIWIGRNA